MPQSPESKIPLNPQDMPVPGQTYRYTEMDEVHDIKTPTSKYYVSPTSAHFGTDFSKIFDPERYPPSGLNVVGTFISATTTSPGKEIVRVGKGKSSLDIRDDLELSGQVKTAIAGFVSDKVITTHEEAQANYLIDDVLDDLKLNGSAPNNPNFSIIR